MELTNIFILSLFQHGYKVRSATVTHLLAGKRTTSVLIYGFFYQLLPYFSLFPECRPQEIEAGINDLIKQKLLESYPDQMVQLTKEGQRVLAQDNSLPLADLNGLRYGRVADEFSELLLFASQVISEYCHSNLAYLPIEKNPAKQYRIKQWFSQMPRDKKLLGQAFFKEWQQLLLKQSDLNRDPLARLLSGHRQIGQTFDQAFGTSLTDPFERRLFQLNWYHLMLNEIERNEEAYPYFYSLYQLVSQRTLNDSAQKSYHLFLRGAELETIAKQRRIKVSTVTDHLIEGALLDHNFPFERLLDHERLAEFSDFIVRNPNIRDWRFGEIIETIHDLTFLEFRCYQIKHIRGEGI